MSRASASASVLAAAVALRRFTAARLAAYCVEDEQTVVAVLAGNPGLVERLPETSEWRVVDPAAVRRQLAGAAPGGAPARAAEPRRSRNPSWAAARLLLAEQTLLECAREPAAANRQVMASTAMNHLQQYVAASLADPRSWWDVDLAGRVSVADLRVDSEIITAARLRIDIALAALTRAEAVGEKRQIDELIPMTRDVSGLPSAMNQGRRSALVDRFATLASAVIRLPDGPPSRSAPARFLTALAVRRTVDEVERSLGNASVVLIRLLRGLVSEPALRDVGPSSRLFRVLGCQPDGQVRVAVYADLLQLIPSSYRWRPQSALLPGAVVEAVAEDRASLHLRDCAFALEWDLARSPFNSESALIGQAAHVMEDLAFRHSDLDDTVVPRSDRTRRELLSLADVLV